MLCIVAHALNILNIYSNLRNIVREFVIDRDYHKEQLMSYLMHTNRCRDIIRMGLEAFIIRMGLETNGLVKDAIWSMMEE